MSMTIAVPFTHQSQPGGGANGLLEPLLGPHHDSLSDAELAMAMQEEEYVLMPPCNANSEQVSILVGKQHLIILDWLESHMETAIKQPSPAASCLFENLTAPLE